MNNLKEKAEDILDKYFNIYYISDSTNEDIVKAMIEFSKAMCELQKQECADNSNKQGAFGVYHYSPLVDRDSILNCKNVCNEE